MFPCTCWNYMCSSMCSSSWISYHIFPSSYLSKKKKKREPIVSTEQRFDTALIIYSYDARDNCLNDLWLFTLPRHVTINQGSKSNYKIVGVRNTYGKKEFSLFFITHYKRFYFHFKSIYYNIDTLKRFKILPFTTLNQAFRGNDQFSDTSDTYRAKLFPSSSCAE